MAAAAAMARGGLRPACCSPATVLLFGATRSHTEASLGLARRLMQARDRSEARGRAVAVLMPQQHSHEGCTRSRSSYRGRRIPYPGAHLDESWLKLAKEYEFVG